MLVASAPRGRLIVTQLWLAPPTVAGEERLTVTGSAAPFFSVTERLARALPSVMRPERAKRLFVAKLAAWASLAVGGA
jgi:hypothetical protein